jgi:hypothetical protein
VYDADEKQRYIVTLYECYPKSIGAVQLDYSSKEVMKLQVSMNYKYWISAPVSDTKNKDVNNYAVEPKKVSNDYFNDAPNATTKINSFEDSRAGLFESDPANVTTGKGSIFT